MAITNQRSFLRPKRSVMMAENNWAVRRNAEMLLSNDHWKVVMPMVLP